MVKIVLTLCYYKEETGVNVVRTIEKFLKNEAQGEWTIERAIETRTELKPVTTRRILDPTNNWEETKREHK